jgi:hypothetical protein
MSETTATKAMLAKIRALLDKAESTEFEGEADTYRAKAEELMRKYRVEEEQAIAADPASLKPVSHTVDVSDSAEFGQQYYSMLHWIIGHVGGRLRGRWAYDPERRASVIKATVVAYESDMRMAELLFTNARMAFSAHLEPKPDPTLTDQVNAYLMRRAGMERYRVAQLLWGSDPRDGTAHGKVGALYKAECAERDEKPALSGRGVNAKLYRKEYADAFAQRIWERLRRAREGADKVGGLPALHGRQERVDEAFYEIFPEERPVPTTADVVVKDDKKKAVKAAKWTKADEAAYRRRNRPEARAARTVGREAADTVAIDGSEGAHRLEEGVGTWSERAWKELDA